MSKFGTKQVVMAALFAALSYVGFAVFRIDVPVGPTKTAFHLGNTFVVLAAFVMGGPLGGLSGAVGLTIADLTTGYALYAPTTFLLKLGIGLVSGLVAHRIGHINEQHGTKLIRWSFLGSAAGLCFNIIADPLAAFVRTWILTQAGVHEINGKALQAMSLPQLVAKMAALTTAVNALMTVIVVTLVYSALAGMLKRSGFPLYLTHKQSNKE